MNIKRAAAAVVTMGAVMTFASPALAYTQYTWRPSDNPIIVKESDGSKRGAAYGVWNLVDTSNGLRSHGKAKLYDYRPGGNGIYTEMQTQSNAGYCFQPDYTSCESQWYEWRRDQTSRWFQKYYSTYQLMSTSVDPNGSYARALVKVCEDQAWSGDPCTSWAYTSGANKY